MLKAIKNFLFERAIFGGHLRLARYLIKHIDVDDPYYHYRWVIVNAIHIHQSLPIIRLLLEHGVNVKLSDGDFFYDHRLMALFERDDPHYPDMEKPKKMAIIGLLLKYGANVHYKYAGRHDYLLFQAVTDNDTEMVELLLQYGANVHAKDESGNENTLLALAVKYDNFEIVALLLKYGANIHVESNRYEDYPLAIAIVTNNIRGVKFLLEHGANIHAKRYDSQLETEYPLILAIERHQFKMFQLLLKYYPDIQSNEHSKFPLLAAIETGDHNMVRLLVKYGANVLVPISFAGTISKYNLIAMALRKSNPLIAYELLSTLDSVELFDCKRTINFQENESSIKLKFFQILLLVITLQENFPHRSIAFIADCTPFGFQEIESEPVNENALINNMGMWLLFSKMYAATLPSEMVMYIFSKLRVDMSHIDGYPICVSENALKHIIDSQDENGLDNFKQYFEKQLDENKLLNLLLQTGNESTYQLLIILNITILYNNFKAGPATDDMSLSVLLKQIHATLCKTLHYLRNGKSFHLKLGNLWLGLKKLQAKEDALAWETRDSTNYALTLFSRFSQESMEIQHDTLLKVANYTVLS